MIPSNINYDNVIQAIKEIDIKGIPEGRRSTKYIVVFEGRLYPPKYLISLANKYATGKLLDPELFSGGKESNSFLQRLGFIIYCKETSQPFKKKTKKESPKVEKERKKHTERCPYCKRTVERMLTKIYGEVKSNYKFDIGVHPSDYNESPYYEDLRIIFESLQKLRGHHDFIRTKNLPHVDYYIPDPGFVLEFDESQHFTAPRKESLMNYPEYLELGFSKDEWEKLCDIIKKKDNDPPYRDEQKAWYDTLRDFLPTILNLKPTVRLYASDYEWCKLDAENQFDIDHFHFLVENSKNKKRINIRKDINPKMARIVIAGRWDGKVSKASSVLNDIYNNWQNKQKVNFLITCGAFLNFEWPDNLDKAENNKFPERKTLEQLEKIAIERCNELFDNNLIKKMRECTDYITIGIDSFKTKISTSQTSIRQPHVEMVLLLELATKKIFVTGKSYPTAGQEDGLFRYDDINTHFINTKHGKVMLLGCHDLNVFSPRGEATTKKEWRRKVRRSFYELLKKEKPNIVLHHPHTTDSSKIWTSAWNELYRTSQNEIKYISAGRYYHPDGARSSIEQVLNKTKSGNSIDFIAYL